MNKIIHSIIVLMFAYTLQAEPSKEINYIQDAQETLQATFKNMQFTEFKESPIEGLFELNVGGQIVYFEPKNGYLIFGEIFNKKGISLTAESIKKQSTSASNELPYESALMIGSDDATKTIIEFTDPDCPYCTKYNKFITDGDYQNTRRVVFFDTRIHPKAAIKAEHILCSKDPEAEMLSIYQGNTPQEYISCDKGKKNLMQHALASKKAGVRGTPSFLLDGDLLTGFRKTELLLFIGNNETGISPSK